jgi:hypothetical protein
MRVASVHLGPFVFGPNTLWLGLHRFLMFIILMFAAFLFGAIFFTKNPDVKTGAGAEDLRRMFGALLMISGIIPDIGSAWPIPILSCVRAPTGITFMEFTAGFRHRRAL